MKKLYLFSIFLVLLSCKEENIINAQTEEKFIASTKNISNNLPSAEKQNFEKAINIIQVESKRIKYENSEKYGNITHKQVALELMNGKSTVEIQKTAEDYLKKQKNIEIKTVQQQINMMDNEKQLILQSDSYNKDTFDEIEYQLNELDKQLQKAQHKSEKISDWKIVNAF